MQLAKRIVDVAPSATLAISTKSKQMKAAGQDVIDLSIGQPDFATPKAIQAAAEAAIQTGSASFYTPATGLPALKQAISDRVLDQTGTTYTEAQIAVTTGAKFALASAFNVLLNPGDEVLIPVPAWVSYVEQVRLAGGKPHLVQPDNGFKVSIDALEAARTAKTKAVVINSPQNPSGTVYSKQELTLIGNWALKHEILVISDEIYRDLMYNGASFTSMVSLDPAITANTLLIGGVSKSYAMTGWRIGFAAGPAKLIKAMATYIGHVTGNAAAASQYAAIEAYSGSQAPVESMRQAFEKRLNQILPALKQVPGFELEHEPKGAFYLFPKAKRAAQLAGFATVDEFVNGLLETTGVAIVPGRAFGMPDHVRLSYATDLDSFLTGLDRITTFINNR